MNVRPSTVKTATRVPSRASTIESSGPGESGGIIGGAEDLAGAIEDLEDLILAINVVAHRHDVDAGLDQFFVAFQGQARPAGGVLGVADDQSQPPARDQTRQHLAHDLAAGSTDDVTDEEDFQRHGEAHSSHGYESRRRRMHGAQRANLDAHARSRAARSP